MVNNQSDNRGRENQNKEKQNEQQQSGNNQNRNKNSGNFANDPNRASEAGRKGGENSQAGQS